MRDPYKALGVDKNASDSEIKKAYRHLAKQYHPDRTGGDKKKEERFKDISAAYEILSDPQKRAQFEQAASGGAIPMGDLSEIFAQMFGGMGGGRGARVHTSGFGGASSPFGGASSPFGGMGGMGGMGASPFGGMGGSPFGGMGAPGRGPARPAAPRAKKKPAPKERKVKAADGSLLRQMGETIYSDLRISFAEAMLGVVANVPTLTGKAKVRIPAGTCSGQKLRLKEKGAKKADSGSKKGHGDHIVTVHIDVPKVDAGESSELLAKLVESLGKDKP